MDFISIEGVYRFYTLNDVDWAGKKEDTSTSAHLVFYGRSLISWKSSKQCAVARSSTEAEYRSLTTTSAELTWIRSLLSELCIQVQHVPTIYCDNLSATYLSINPVMHSRMKHIAIDVHFVRDLVQLGILRVQHVSTTDQLVDCLTKPLSAAPSPSQDQDWYPWWHTSLAVACQGNDSTYKRK